MSTLASNWKRVVFTVMSIVTAALLAYWVLVGGSGTSGGTSKLEESRPVVTEWPADSAPPIQLSVDPATGPTWRLDSHSLRFSPVEPAEDLEWRIRESGDNKFIVGRGTSNGSDFSITWRLAKGDPQVGLSVGFHDLPLEVLRKQPITLSLEVPKSQVVASDGALGLAEVEAPYRIDPWDPAWLQWRLEDSAVTVADWSGDGLTVRPSKQGDALAIDFHVWRPELHPAVSNCTGGKEKGGQLGVDLDASARVVFGRDAPVFPSRFPAGREAALLPLFDTARSHPDSTLHRGGPDGPDEWAERTRTLVYGHSDPDDPRYGNGGLLGHGLGGTVAVDSTHASSKPVVSLRREFEESDVDIALRNSLSNEKKEVGVSIHDAFSCQAIVDRNQGELQTVIGDVSPFRDKLTFAGSTGAEGRPFVSPPTGSFATFARPLRLDGTRPQLIDHALSAEALDRLVSARGFALFSTPFLATRNPLTPVATEALLEPERHGKWTLAAPFAAALADLELYAETQPVSVTSLDRMVGFWRDARRVRRAWTPKGQLVVARTANRGLAGYTLVVDGFDLPADSITISNADKVDVRRTHHRGSTGTRPQTWISWNLDPKTKYRIDFGDRADEIFSASPVRWKLGE